MYFTQVIACGIIEVPYNNLISEEDNSRHMWQSFSHIYFVYSQFGCDYVCSDESGLFGWAATVD